MIPYTSTPVKTLSDGSSDIYSFISKSEENIDWETVDSFGSEWEKFHAFDDTELDLIGADYFDLADSTILTPASVVLDVGCGSGRWSRYLADRVKFIEAIDPSHSVITANLYLKDKENIRVTQASVNNIPFADKQFDFVYSLGVLHHLPDTQQAIGNCIQKLKPGGWLLIYLYYALDNRGILYRILFRISTFFRLIICRLPQPIKKFICDLIAGLIYFPLARFSLLLSRFTSLRSFSKSVPLSYYSKTSFHIMRNDALDRFGTPLEKRFKKTEIEQILTNWDLTNIRFSDKAPFWHVIAQRK
jgi:SAM-dependent methyltransferase